MALAAGLAEECVIKVLIDEVVRPSRCWTLGHDLQFFLELAANKRQKGSIIEPQTPKVFIFAVETFPRDVAEETRISISRSERGSLGVGIGTWYGSSASLRNPVTTRFGPQGPHGLWQPAEDPWRYQRVIEVKEGMSTTNVRAVAASPSAGDKAALKAIKNKQTKREILTAITEETGLARKDVVAVLDSVAKMVRRHVMKRGSGEISIPEMGIKVRRVDRKARTGRNPKTGEPIRVPAKTVVRATVLKSLKEVAA